MKRFIGEELIALTRKRFSLSERPEDTFIAGVSMGGFGSLLVGSHYGNTFGKIGCISGAFIIGDVLIGNFGVLGRDASVSYFKDIFGDFETLEGSDRDPLGEALHALKKGSLPPVFLYCGREDVLYRGNRKLLEQLRKAGAMVFWKEEAGGHEWNCFQKGLEYMLKWSMEE